MKYIEIDRDCLEVELYDSAELIGSDQHTLYATKSGRLAIRKTTVERLYWSNERIDELYPVIDMSLLAGTERQAAAFLQNNIQWTEVYDQEAEEFEKVLFIVD